MASNAYQTPDLASILATLAAYAPPPQPQTTHTVPPAASTPTLFPDEHLPPASAPQQHPVPSPAPQPHQPPPIDPATLTTWPSALRCITRTIARNEAALARIRHLIHTQQQHERQWWEGREALVRKQQQRGEGRKALDEVLKAVGGKVDTTRTDPTPTENRTELHAYDLKVHSASTAMVRATVSELKALGVPFFGMKPEMIVSANEAMRVNEPGRADETVVGDVSRQPNRHNKIEERELQKLQKRMLELLEDLCRG